MENIEPEVLPEYKWLSEFYDVMELTKNVGLNL